MKRISLTNGAYRARSVIASAQRAVNLYAELNPGDSLAPMTHYPVPGLVQLSPCPSPDIARGLFRTTNGALYAVVGQNVYSIDQAFAWTLLGAISAGNNPASLSDNATSAFLVDGTRAGGYTILLSPVTGTPTFAQTADPAFLGADRVDYIDTFFTFNSPGSQELYVGLSNSTTFDSLDVAGKVGGADLLVTQVVFHDQILLLGSQTAEIWFNSGAADFSFQKTPGVFIEHGCAAKYSVAKQDDFVYWLSQDPQGSPMVLKLGGFQAIRISTHAIEAAIQGYATWSDAVGYTYQQQGHVFYVIDFPSADRTWVWDEATALWHEEATFDSNGIQHRRRGSFGAYCYGANLCLDWQTGALYRRDLKVYSDNGQSLRRIKSFPHMMGGGNRLVYWSFVADMDVGQAAGTLASAPPLVDLRWSDTRGASYGSYVSQSAGSGGQYETQIKWSRLGMARDRVFELSWDFPYPTALNGAFIEVQAAT